MFKSKEEKQREAELEAQRLEKERIEEAEKEIAEQRAREREFNDMLKEKAKNNIACFYTSNIDEKQAILNFFLTNGFICVQNDFSCTKYSGHCVLTFVKEDLKDRFS